MTAGTDPDPAESSHAVKMPSIMQISHMPYLDHNYGQPPPMTPPDSNSPAPEDIDTGNEDEEGNAVTRCICGFDHDDGYMICCDKCSVWQHIECMGISSESLPDNYLCEQCEPRMLDRDRAKVIQTKKKEEMSDDDDDDNDESAEEIDGTTYTAFSNTPTRITLTAKVSHPKRKTPGPKVKGEKDKDKKTKRRKRPKQRIPIPEFLPVDEETNGPWESNCNNRDYYQEVKECTYSKGLEEIAGSLAQTNQVRCIPDGIDQYCKEVEVQRNIQILYDCENLCAMSQPFDWMRKDLIKMPRHSMGLVATEDLHKDQFLIKFKGKMMLGSEFDEENQMFRRYNPYVLFYYNNPDCPKLCVDARVLGNEARFIRRSCSPNAEVRHVLQNDKLYLAVFSQIPLPKGVEITIPFEFTYSDYHCSLSCACAQDTCAVAKYKLKYQISGQELNSVAEQNGHPICDDSSNSSHNPLTASPPRAMLATQNSFQGDSDSDLDNNQDRSTEGESSRRKLSREERKLEAYVKQIERLEKKEKKRQQPPKDHRQAVRLSSDDGSKPHIKGMRCAKRLNHKRRSNGVASGLKKKRPRVSSCSSEPLSPDEVSSSASTPTTPKPVSTIPEEPQHETPSTSPSRNFQFPKTKPDDNSHQDAVITSALSSPTSPCSPRESETETKPTLSTASSNSDIVMEMEMEDSDNGHLEESQEDCTRDIESDLSDRLAEIACVSRSECNTPSPCPSSSASPTRCESVMNGCPSTMVTGSRSPGPAPGSRPSTMVTGSRSPGPAPGSRPSTMVTGSRSPGPAPGSRPSTMVTGSRSPGPAPGSHPSTMVTGSRSPGPAPGSRPSTMVTGSRSPGPAPGSHPSTMVTGSRSPGPAPGSRPSTMVIGSRSPGPAPGPSTMVTGSRSPDPAPGIHPSTMVTGSCSPGPAPGPSTMVTGSCSPGPAPGSPLAALLHGVHSTHSNPLYCSLKKRWLYKFLNSQNGVGLSRPLNGVRTLTFVEKEKDAVVNHKTTTTPMYKEPLPLKKRYLRSANSSWTTKTGTVITSTPSMVSESISNSVVSNADTTTRLSAILPHATISNNEANKFIKSELENQVVINPASVLIDTNTTRTELTPDTRTLSRGREIVSDTTTAVVDYSEQGYIGRGTIDTVPDVKPVVISTAPIRRTSDPRQQSPSSQFSSTSLVTTLQQALTVITSPSGSTVMQSGSFSSGTPGKKKVSLLEYRNRSLQRLSGDGPKPALASTSQVGNTNSTTISTASMLTTTTTPLKISTTNVISPINHHIVTKKPDSVGTNGPSIEPISPEENDQFQTSRLKLSKSTNSPLYDAKLNSLAKKEAGVNMYNKKLSALISEQLLSNPTHSPGSSSKSPSTASNSPSVPPPPPPPPDTAGKGDAMEIEEEDSQPDQTIYVTSQLISPTRPHIQAPSQPTIINTEYGLPHHSHQITDYRLHDHHPHAQSSLLIPMIQQPSSSQLPSPMSGQTSQLPPRISPSPYLVAPASQPIPSQIRFPASYQNPSVQSAPYYQQ